MRLDASGTRMPWGNCHVSGVLGSGLLVVSDMARFRVLLLGRREGRPRSMMDDSEMFLLCDVTLEAIVAMGSRRSTLGDPRLEAGDAVLKGFVNTVGGVGRGT
jgi:hypothetical protein